VTSHPSLTGRTGGRPVQRAHIILSGIALILGIFAASGASALPFTGVLSVHYSGSPDVPSLVVSGGGVSSDSPGGAFSLPAGAITGTDSVNPTSPGTLPTIAGLDLSVASGAGSFATATPFGGTISLGGTLSQFYFSRSLGGAVIPLDVVGLGGTQPYSSLVGSGTISGTITGSPWTIGTVTTTDLFGTQTASGFDSRAPNGQGAIRLVTAFDVTTDILNVPHLDGIATLDLTFVPEPGTLLLIALGVAGFGLLGR